MAKQTVFKCFSLTAKGVLLIATLSSPLAFSAEEPLPSPSSAMETQGKEAQAQSPIAGFEFKPVKVTAADHTAHEVVEDVTEKVLAMIKHFQAQENPDTNEVATGFDLLLTPVVDFGYIARNVMGSTAKGKATDKQVQAFTETFKTSLIDTYTRGVTGFVNREVVVVPPEGDVSKQRRVSVLQEVKGPDGMNRVSYTLGINKSGDWQLLNVVLDGINLGRTFRNQFAQALKQANGDVDAVINNWGRKG
ncbi:phospholipid-binding protein MlaC [Marinibactrum halimedae]|uniref:Toluene tolerance protein n=1 Tax=Marinibactrum halimedae TaxID=1444977 RepID=A0AA37WMU4_9GAMM|nr:ABC transporter substrate-binding protein [Marinibactrum halimedae]MCD9457530.1 ABC transporter substrate-binding protein [Marinibactrum halimedae]GLS25416.1 toluene tolerance protein [Marinibactrum halimedae]